jgi:hypothetical protein
MTEPYLHLADLNKKIMEKLIFQCDMLADNGKNTTTTWVPLPHHHGHFNNKNNNTTTTWYIYAKATLISILAQVKSVHVAFPLQLTNLI